MNTRIMLAVAKRNFVSYFASPTAYLFICVFVALSTMAAFWPNEFFDANLANLDQLNKWFPYVMLVFIPAITMGIWADERRQGTDELLLTMPATDWEVVLGKFLAATAIFTVSLLFSFVCNYVVLRSLGEPDFGLFVATYFGYWLMGLAMLGIGMVASFFTANLTVAYIFGVILNAPAVFLASADVIVRQDLALRAKAWSIAEQFANFGRGLISLSGLAYFLLITAVTLYVAMILIGRRHWPTGESRLPAGLFFTVLHLTWLGSVIFIGSMLASQWGNSTLLIVGLVIVYLALHTALVLIWQVKPNLGRLQTIYFVAPVAQIITVLAGAVVAVLWGQQLVSRSIFWLLFAIVILLHALFFVGWATFPRAMSLMPAHFIVRTSALAATALGLVAVLQAGDVRIDITSERISSLSPHTLQILKSLDPKYVVQVEAFISPEVPESYIQTRVNLINLLREFEARAKNVRVRINNTELFTEEAQRAADRFNITPQRVFALQQGRWTEHRIFMGVAFTCGLERVVVPFIDRDIPVEYELIRSIATVTQQKRKRIGILTTDAQLFGQFSFQGGQERWPIVDELQKQYEVVRVEPADLVTNDEECEKAGLKVLGLTDASEEKIIERGRELLGLETPIDKLSDQEKANCKARVKEEAMKLGRWDALLAVQPSSLAPEDLDRFVAAISYGQPTVIFEDPMPIFASAVPGTGQERRPPQQMMMFGMRPLPKGDISKLWQKLGIDFTSNQIVWQRYNPYPKFLLFEENPEFVFINWSCGSSEPFYRQEPAVAGLQQVLFPFPGAITRLNSSKMNFVPLVRTGRVTGLVNYDDIFRLDFLTGSRELNRNRQFLPTKTEYVLAARIQGKVPEMKITKSQNSGSEASPATIEEVPDRQHDVNVILVSDIDMLHETFFRLRQRQDLPGLDLKLSFDNVTMVLNLIDLAAGDDRFIDIRNRRPRHRTLTTIERATEAARNRTAEERQKLQEAYNRIEREEREKLEQSIKKLEEDMKKQNISLDEILRRVAIAQEQGERRLNARMEEERQKRDRELERIETDLTLYVRRLQNFYKMVSVVIPPLFPLGLAAIVFVWRRAKELEGVPAARRVRGSGGPSLAAKANED